jgi:hypothetical protein
MVKRQYALKLRTAAQSHSFAVQESIQGKIDEMIGSLPDPAHLSPEERRGIIARYTAVLEPNFIYWMTATFLSVSSVEAHDIIEDNLREEITDNHPGMLRKFAVGAHSVPTDSDLFAVHRKLQDVRSFVAKLRAVPLILMMAFFEGFIMRFMPYLAGLASSQGSAEREYTDVHGVVDITHTQELFRAFLFEMEFPRETRADETSSPAAMFEGVQILGGLIETVIRPDAPELPS